jgi:hypothetical protein
VHSTAKKIILQREESQGGWQIEEWEVKKLEQQPVRPDGGH